VHPNKFNDPRAPQAFHIIENAYKTLLDPKKRQIYQRIMREARDRTLHETEKENKRRRKIECCQRIFDEIEERKQRDIRLAQSQKQRKRQQLEERWAKEQI